jgi:hypothetical protein
MMCSVFIDAIEEYVRTARKERCMVILFHVRGTLHRIKVAATGYGGAL